MMTIRTDFPTALSKNGWSWRQRLTAARTAVTAVLFGTIRLTNGLLWQYATQMLLFKKKFLTAIRNGEKTQTIRLWKYRRMRAGQRSYIPTIGYIRITAVEEVELGRLTDADARPDGFATADLLRAELDRLYPRQLAAGYRAYRIVFKLAPDETKEEIGKPNGE